MSIQRSAKMSINASVVIMADTSSHKRIDSWRRWYTFHRHFGYGFILPPTMPQVLRVDILKVPTAARALVSNDGKLENKQVFFILRF